MIELQAHPSPLIRAGGLFLLIVGAAIVLGAIFPRRIWQVFVAGVALASAAVGFVAVPLTQPLGTPSRTQLVSLLVALAFEGVAIAWVGRRHRPHDERALVLAILAVVGLHFLPMGVAFGPVVAALGLLAAANAGAGLLLFRITPLRVFWLWDGLLKVTAGAVMFWLAPRLAWG